MITKNTTRAAIYVRVSTSDQSTQMQLDELSPYAAARGWVIAETYQDQASGTSTEKRPMWQKAMKDARLRRFDVLVVWRLDRWARSLKDLILSLQELESIGVKFISLRDNIDFSVPSGRLMLHIIGAFADFEAQIIKERVRAGIAAAKARGQRLGRPPRLNGNRIRDLRLSGMTLGAIAKEVGASKGGVSKSLRKHRA